MSAIPVVSHTGGALIASSDGAVCRGLIQRLDGRRYKVSQVAGGADALASLEHGQWEVLFLDRKLPDLDAEELSEVIRKRFPQIEVILVNGDNENTGESIEEGQCRKTLPSQSYPLRGNWHHCTGSLPGMIGNSAAMQRVYRMVQLVAPRTTTVLVIGPTGSGKELVARAVHALSPRSAKPLVIVNCAAIPETLLESELFGYVRGAFTGAIQSQVGRVMAANGGTLFLDEISEIPLGMQSKLLRFLEQKEIQRLGTNEVTRVDVRVIAASNADLASRAMTGEFRKDLYFRLSTFPIELPALVERRGDIVPLARHFLATIAASMGIESPRLSQEAVALLEGYSWKGNVRELQHVMERASIMIEAGNTIQPEHLAFSYPPGLVDEVPRSKS